MSSAFRKWFKEQFKILPLPPTELHDIAVRIRLNEDSLNEDKEYLAQQVSVQNQYTAALYAWQARERVGDKIKKA